MDKNEQLSFITVYSENSIEALEKLLKTFFDVFEITRVKPSDLFYSGVFCDIDTYANYNNYDSARKDSIKIPIELDSSCYDTEERENFVKTIMSLVLIREISKPEWMYFVEEHTMSVSGFEVKPSTHLYLKPKENKYKELGEKLIEFLESSKMVNRIINGIL